MARIEIPDVEFMKFHETWLSTRSPEKRFITPFLDLLRQFHPLLQERQQERFVLFGTEQTVPEKRHPSESLVGTLIGAAESVLVLWPVPVHWEFCGMIEKRMVGETAWYVLRPFSPSSFNASLIIRPNDAESLFPNCARRMDLESGDPKAPGYQHLGVSDGRWEMMKKFFQRWLLE